MFNYSMTLLRYASGLIILAAFALWLLPYLFALLGVFTAGFNYFRGLPPMSLLLSMQPTPYKAFLLLLLTSAVARGLLKRI